ncbi:hypothetical protein [Burkholderia cenocepacia]|uniref:hypothetical protein n=1 Tax=Burkholderia cenocepacia TaxID=95486 RepID=UPI002AAFF8F8|nr:hypothetical protein [Burkholderia cenocepacia]
MWFKTKKQRQTEQPKKILSESEDWAAHYAAQRERQERADREFMERHRAMQAATRADIEETERKLASGEIVSQTAMKFPPNADELFNAENVSTILQKAFQPTTGPTGIEINPFRAWPEGAREELCFRLIACVPTILHEISEATQAAQEEEEVVHTPQATFVDVTDNSPTRGTFYS